MHITSKLNAILLLFLSAVVAGIGRDIYVSWSGTNNPPFTNWPDAATNIEWAVNIAWKDDTVWISNGTYYLTNQITVSSNITISGTGTVGGVTVVDGNNANRCFYFPPAVTGTLANLFITGGNTNADGGGAYMFSGTVRDCIFSNNFCATNGGGLYITNGIVQRCAFIANKASSGGGLYFFKPRASMVDSCTFYTNIATNSGSGNGGGLMVSDAKSLMIVTGCVFISNIASNRGGGAECWYAPAYITHCTFASNVSFGTVDGGGGMWISYAVISNCYFSNNIAMHAGGGGIYNAYGTVKNCVIARNQAFPVAYNSGGGGVQNFASGVAGYEDPTIQNCIIEENYSENWGGGVFFQGGNLRNCLIRNNVAATLGGGGARVYVFSGATQTKPIRISACTIVSNYTGSSGGGIAFYMPANRTVQVDNCIVYLNKYNGSGAFSNFWRDLSGSIPSSFSNCCIAPEPTDLIVANNITVDPLFADWQGGNYRLQANSPCVNTGAYRGWMTNALDLDGLIRIRYGTVDMGAYEAISAGTIYKYH